MKPRNGRGVFEGGPGFAAKLAVDLEQIVKALIGAGRTDGEGHAILSDVLAAAIRITEADIGTLQIVRQGALNLEVQIGFDRSFTEHFAVVRDATCACGVALQMGQRILVEDAAASSVFGDGPDRNAILTAGVAAVQSRPLVYRGEKIVAMLSTHYRTPRELADRDFQRLDLLADLTGALIQRAGL
ncbi:MAG TPA: GAF domain-containing protein [Bryobacteraceae bacterium]|nr:GAF domain-containing protein [Bryobacteraceae bacterium]